MSVAQERSIFLKNALKIDQICQLSTFIKKKIDRHLYVQTTLSITSVTNILN